MRGNPVPSSDRLPLDVPGFVQCAERTMIADPPTMTAVICTYTEDRYALLCQAIDSLANQTQPAEEILVVVDHNPALLERIGHDRPNVRVIANSGPQGLSGARNSGLDACHTTLI